MSVEVPEENQEEPVSKLRYLGAERERIRIICCSGQLATFAFIAHDRNKVRKRPQGSPKTDSLELIARVET